MINTEIIATAVLWAKERLNRACITYEDVLTTIRANDVDLYVVAHIANLVENNYAENADCGFAIDYTAEYYADSLAELVDFDADKVQSYLSAYEAEFAEEFVKSLGE